MDIDFTSLTITCHAGQAVPNQFLRQRVETSTLFVMLPGLGYTTRMPLFYYAEQIALERGWDVLSVDYSYRPLEYHDDPEIRNRQLDARKAELHADVEAALAEGLRQRHYERIVLVGKSLGTRAMEHLLAAGIEREVWSVWLTPLIDEPAVRDQIERFAERSFVAIGTADFAYDAAYLADLDGREGTAVVVIEDADHSMDIPGDLAGSIQAVGNVMARLDAFLPPP